MRITNSIITSSAIRSMLISQRGMDAASKQVSSGLRVDRVSQDPTAGTQAMGAASELRALAQYRRNVERASAASDAQETVLNSLSELLGRARELGISQATATASPQTRQAVKQEVDQLLRMAASLGNTRHDGAYLFGGSQSLTPPVTLIDGATPNFTVATTGAAMEYVLSPGQRIRVNDTASEIFGTTAGGALSALRALSLALDANDVSQISAAVEDLRSASGTVQDRLGATGARSNQLQVTRANVDALALTLTAYKSQLVEVDVEQAITELVAKQTTYQAAMLATSRVIELNLTNYLR
jgi:flagellar hook-associated protein 3 FlgL